MGLKNDLNIQKLSLKQMLSNDSTIDFVNETIMSSNDLHKFNPLGEVMDDTNTTIMAENGKIPLYSLNENEEEEIKSASFKIINYDFHEDFSFKRTTKIVNVSISADAQTSTVSFSIAKCIVYAVSVHTITNFDIGIYKPVVSIQNGSAVNICSFEILDADDALQHYLLSDSDTRYVANPQVEVDLGTTAGQDGNMDVLIVYDEIIGGDTGIAV